MTEQDESKTERTPAEEYECHCEMLESAEPDGRMTQKNRFGAYYVKKPHYFSTVCGSVVYRNGLDEAAQPKEVDYVFMGDIINRLGELEDKSEAADVVEIVRCRDCVHHSHNEVQRGRILAVPDVPKDYTCPYLCSHNPYLAMIPADDFFCAYGERRNAE